MMEGDGLERALVETLADPVERSRHGQEVLLLMTILVSYRKYEVRFVLSQSKVDADGRRCSRRDDLRLENFIFKRYQILMLL